jgi:hypothetical protein
LFISTFDKFESDRYCVQDPIAIDSLKYVAIERSKRCVSPAVQRDVNEL